MYVRAGAYPCKKRNVLNTKLKLNFVNKMHFHFSLCSRAQSAFIRPPDAYNEIYVKYHFEIHIRKKIYRPPLPCTHHTPSHYNAIVLKEWTIQPCTDETRPSCTYCQQSTVYANLKLDCLSVWHMIPSVSDVRLDAIVWEWRKSSRHLFLVFFFLIKFCHFTRRMRRTSLHLNAIWCWKKKNETLYVRNIQLELNKSL